MSHFVSLMRPVPDPDLDAISQVAIGLGSAPGSAEIGLHGYWDDATKSEVVAKIVKGPGSIRAGGKRGSRVMAYGCYGLTEASVIQGFLGTRPWTAPLPVVRQAIAGKKRNEMLLTSTDPLVREANVYVPSAPNSFPVRVVPVPVNGFASATSYRGLAIHVTGEEGKAESIVKSTWGSSGVSAHFVIERSGCIAQCVAFTLRGEAQGGKGTVGDPNADWLSVELVCKMNNAGTDGFFTGSQIMSARQLFFDLADKFKFPRRIASPLINDLPAYQAVSRSIAAMNGLTGASSYADAQKSRGLSCHRWLNSGHACPGLLGLATMAAFAGVFSSGTDYEF